MDTLGNCLTAMLGLLPHIEADTSAMARAARQGFATATDFADYLVRRGAPFRDAHEAVGKAVAYAVQQGIELDEIPLAQLKTLAGERVEADVFDVLTVEGSLAARNHIGGAAPTATAQAIRAGRERIAAASP